MNAYIEPLSQSIWNFEFEDVDLSRDIPRIAALRGMRNLLLATVTDNPQDRENALTELDAAMKICKSYSGNKKNLEELSYQIVELNEALLKQMKEEGIQDQDTGHEKIPVHDTIRGSLQPEDLERSLLFEKDDVGEELRESGLKSISMKFENRPLPVTDQKLILQNLDIDIEVTIATIDLWIAIVQLLSRNFLSGGLALRRSWKRYHSLYKDVSKNREKYHQDIVDSVEAGTGAFLYGVSVIPGGVLKGVLKVIGFKEDQNLGMSLVWDVLFRQGSEIPMVFLVLSANYLFLASDMDMEDSLSKFRPVIEYCLRRYSNGLTFKFVASVYAKKMGHIHSAISHLESGIRHCDSFQKEYSVIPSTFYLDYGQAYLSLFEYEKAAIVLKKALDAPFDFTKKGLAAFHLAICELQSGKEKELDELLKTMVQLAKKHKQETYTNTKGKILQLCKSDEERNRMLNIAAFEMMYIWREIPHMKPDHREIAIRRFKEKVGDTSSIKIPDLKAAALVIYGQLTHDNKERERCFAEAIDLKKQVKHEKQWIAFAYFELAVIAREKGNIPEALANLKQVFSFKNFPFDDVLHTRAKALEKVIHRE